MTKTSAKVFLSVFGNLLILAVGSVYWFVPFSQFEARAAVSLVVCAAHIVFSAASLRRFKCRFGVSPGEYVLCGVLPAFALALLAFIGSVIYMNAEMPLRGDIVAVPLVLTMFPAAYSLFYLVVMTIVGAVYR